MERPDLAQRNRDAVLLYAQLHTGETIFSKTYNMKMTLVAWRGCNDIDVQFEDGTIVKEQYYHSFCAGNIKYPDFLKKQRLGMTKMMNCGMKATIVEYFDSTDMTVRFEDGYEKKHVSFKAFAKGATTNPNLVCSKQRLGINKVQAKGYVATVVSYEDSQNVIVQFEDGITKKTCWDTFNKGKVAHPSVAYNKNLKDDVLGKTFHTNCGLKATVIEYDTCRRMLVKFEDGEVKSAQFNRLEHGYVKHPKLDLRKEFKYKGFVCKCIYISKDKTYYKVKHEDGFEGIMTPQEMINYQN